MIIKIVRKFIVWIMLGISITFSTYVHATLSSKQLLDLCNDKVGRLICIGYISGFIDSTTLYADMEATGNALPKICIPKEGIANEKLGEMVVDYMKEHQNDINTSARTMIYILLYKTYRCK